MSERLRLVGPIERALYLRTIPSIAEVEPAELEALAVHARERHFRRGTVLLRRGEPVGHVYIVVEGRVRLSGAGPERTAVARDTVGILSLLARGAEGREAVAETDVLALELDAEALLDLFEEHFSALLSQLRTLAGLLIEERRRIQPGTLLSPWTEPATWRQPLDLVERLVILRRTLAFRTTGLDALAELARGMEEVSFTPGARIWQRGEASGHLLLLLGGTVACAFADDAVAFRCGPGYPLGNLESLAASPRWYQATAEGAVVALRGETEGLLDVLEDHFETAMDLVSAMAANLIALRAAADGEGPGNRPLPAAVGAGGEVHP